MISPAPKIKPHGLPESCASALDVPDAAVIPRVETVPDVIDAVGLFVGLR